MKIIARDRNKLVLEYDRGRPWDTRKAILKLLPRKGRNIVYALYGPFETEKERRDAYNRVWRALSRLKRDGYIKKCKHCVWRVARKLPDPNVVQTHHPKWW